MYIASFLYIYIASFLHTYIHKKGHITGYVGLKLKTIQCCNPSNIFARAQLF